MAQVSKTNPSGLPWSPATDGLRNITGRVGWDGKVTIWAITSTVSGSGDQGADPNKLVVITDVLANTDTSAAAAATFTRCERRDMPKCSGWRNLVYTGYPGVDDHDDDDRLRSAITTAPIARALVRPSRAPGRQAPSGAFSIGSSPSQVL